MTAYGDLGPWYRPSQAAPLLGMSARAVRELCQDKRIDHRADTGPAGAVRYLVSKQAIERFHNQTIVRGNARGAA